MRVLIAGATGVLGSGLVRELVGAGHEVVGLSRSVANDAAILAQGAKPIRADLFDADALARAAAGSDVVVRAATHIPKAEWSASEIALMARVRRDGTRALLDATKQAGARMYVQESVAWHDDAARDAERLAAEAGIAASTLRFGWFYGSRSAHTRAMVDALRAGSFLLPADGRARKSMLHVDDAATAMARAIQTQRAGTWEVADVEPITLADYLDALADALGVARPPRGGPADPFLSMECIVDPRPFRAATGWAPRYPSAREGVREIAAEFAATAKAA